ncbi:MAG: Coenzyme F420 hydrogenase/dehydrogenase, beta subunit C-terminal domain [Akkermansiaceae bacterium]|nr:Coenzyme F420 hydrogenase/dehydrogenase, beta subunit C-terminal domain [Akkermansiaceae bacterium]
MILNTLHDVISSDCCIGCGLCSYLAPESISMRQDSVGRIQPHINADIHDGIAMRSLLEICPFADPGPHENELSRELYSESCSYDPEAGYYRSIFAGHVVDDKIREKTSSGGLITWLATQMLQQGLVDAVVHVTGTEEDQSSDPLLFEYSISQNASDILKGAKSKYYPIELSGALQKIRESPGRYLLIGLPCFIKGVRRLAVNDPIIAERIVFTIGLVCGHLKSKFFAELLASQLNISPSDLKTFDFRVKLPERNAGGYGVRATSEESSEVTPSAALFGSDWGLHMFRYGACDFCDDVFAETADVVIGDAWLPEYVHDWKGNSLVISRHEVLTTLLQAGAETGELVLDTVTTEDAAKSQAGGLRDRREDIQWRIEQRRQKNEWAPKKRDFGMPLPTPSRRKLIETRQALRMASLNLWTDSNYRGDWIGFKKALAPLLKSYIRQTRPLRSRIKSKIKGILSHLRILF